MKVWGADIGIAYIEATTKEKRFMVAGPELEELQGHIIVIHKALYGLKSSGLTWSQRIHDIILQLNFRPCKADPCVWLREMKDNMNTVLSEEPQKIIQDLKEKFKL